MYKYLLLLLFVCYVLADVHKISLKKRVNKKWQFLKEDKSNPELKYKFHPRLLSNSRQQSDKIPIYYPDDGYTIAITIGTPPQPFEVVIDTGSSDLIVQDGSCQDLASGAVPCSDEKFYSSLSSTYKFITTGSNEYYNYIIGQDTFGDNGTLLIPNSRFLQVIKPFGEPFGGAILGLAFPSLSVTGGYPPLPSAINQNLLNPPIFTVYLNLTYEYDNAGAITFGGLDTDNCGQVIAYQPLSSTTYYQFTASGISIGNYSNTKSFQVISDTALPYIGGPGAVLDIIAKQIGATPVGTGYYAIDCNATIPTFTVTIGNYQYSIDSDHQKIKFFDGNGVLIGCGWSLVDTTGFGFGPAWALGAPFIQEYCSIYDMGNKRIGFAKAKNA